MRNSVELKIKISDEIIIADKYIILILSEGRENYSNIGHLFQRKVFLTSLLSRINPSYENKKTVSKLKEKLAHIIRLDKIIMDALNGRKEETGDKIAMLKKISAAAKAYGVNNLL